MIKYWYNRTRNLFIGTYNYLTTDVYFISFPKSGRTWVRMMLGHIFTSGNITNIDNDAKYAETQNGRVKITFEHEEKRGQPYTKLTIPSKYRNKKIIFMTRCPKDTVVSYFFNVTDRRLRFLGNLQDFIRDDRWGIKKIVHYNKLWLKNKTIFKKFMVITYEDLHKTPELQILKILYFIGCDKTNMETVRKAIQYCEFENMHRMEKKNQFNDPELSTTNPLNSQSYKTRRGIVGGYKDYLTSEDIKYCDSIEKNRC